MSLSDKKTDPMMLSPTAVQCPHCRNSARVFMCVPVHRYNPSEMIQEDGALIYLEFALGSCSTCQGPVGLLSECRYVMKFGPPRSEVKDSIVYPVFSDVEPPSSDVPNPYREEYIEACRVLPVSEKAASALFRRILQGLLHGPGKIMPKRSLDDEIKEAVLRLPSHIADHLLLVKEIGNFAAHPRKDTSTGEIIDVEPGEADFCREIVMSLFQFYYVDPKRAQKVRDQVNAKLNSAGKKPI
jgi:Domain of unknown function (DUF4145)